MKQQAYAIVIEKGDRNYSAYVPDLPGCVATGRTKQQVQARMREAVGFHIQGMIEDGDAIPFPSTTTSSVQVSVRRKVQRPIPKNVEIVRVTRLRPAGSTERVPPGGIAAKSAKVRKRANTR